MASNDKYILNWESHLTHMKRAFSVLHKSTDFVDVTLVCEGKKIKAHKIILSAFSTYFHDILVDNPCPHPIIILRDILYQEMVGILEFMYLGEVSVAMESFSSFLRVAEMLKISGLAEDMNQNEKENNINKEKEPTQTDAKVETPKGGVKRTRAFEKDKKRVSVEKEEKVVSKKRKDTSSPFPSGQNDENIEEAETPKSTKENESSKMESAQNISNVQKLLSSEDYLVKELNPENECPICAQKFTTMYLLKQHIPYHLGETKCQYCSTVVSRKDLLKKHLMAVHKIPSLKKD